MQFCLKVGCRDKKKKNLTKKLSTIIKGGGGGLELLDSLSLTETSMLQKKIPNNFKMWHFTSY